MQNLKNIPSRLAKFLWHFIKLQPIAFAFVLIASMVWAVNEMFFPYLIKLMVNTVAAYKGDPHGIYKALFKPLLTLVFFWLSMELSMRLQGLVLTYTFPRFRANIRESVFNYVRQHSHEYFSSNFAGTIAKKLSDLPTSCQTLMEILCFNIIAILVAYTIALGLTYHTKPLFAAIFLIWFCLHMFISFFFMHYSNTKWEAHADAATILNGKIVDSISNMVIVRLFARGKYEAQYLKHYQDDEIEKAHSAMLSTELMRFFLGLNGLTLIFTIIFTLIHGWIAGWVSLGDFTFIGMLAFWLIGMVWYMSYQMAVFVREMGTVNEALSLISAGHDVFDVPQAKPLIVSKGEIYFDNVKFSYRDNQVIFDCLSTLIKPGQKVGLVGFSGAGKTTFVSLILRFYDIENGQILIDGQNIAEVSQESLRSQIAMIPQEPTLFHRSLMENIRYGRLDATDNEVIEAAKLAHCAEFIDKLSEGYHTLVGERGIKLSGGQRQRISIARAILKNAPILILDEATSALDSVTEQLIQDSLNKLMCNRTTIVIAHRLSTLTHMDRLLVFHQGKIKEDGTKDELLAANGYFANLWRMQTDGFLPE